VSGEEDSGLSWGERGSGAGVTTRLLRFSMTTAPSPISLVTSGVGMRGRFFSDDGIADPFSLVVPNINYKLSVYMAQFYHRCNNLFLKKIIIF